VFTDGMINETDNGDSRIENGMFGEKKNKKKKKITTFSLKA
jgi:hypothetical protein